MVTWEDSYFTADKYINNARSPLRMTHHAQAGIMKGKTELFHNKMEQTSDITNMFTIALSNGSGGGTTSWSVTSSGAPQQGDNCLKVQVADSNGTASFKKRWVEASGDFVSGWKRAKARVHIYTTGANNTTTKQEFRVFLIEEGSQGVPTQKVYMYGIRISPSGTTLNWEVVRAHDGTTATWVDSLIPFPTENEWTKLEIEYDGTNIIYYIDGTKCTISPYLSDMASHVQIELYSHNSRAGASHYFHYWDSLRLWTGIEHNDDTALYPDHRHQVETIDIGGSSVTEWGHLELEYRDVTVEQHPTEDSYITWSIHKASDDTVIPGLENRTETWYDLSEDLDASACNEVYVRLKFHDYGDTYDAPVIKCLKVIYAGTDARVTLSVISNSYNDDLTPPIEVKSGYPITFKITTKDYYYGQLRSGITFDVTISYYYIDFGDGTNSGWITHNQVLHTYTRHSQNVPEAGTDQEWNAKAKVMYSNGETSDNSVIIDVDVLNEVPVANLFCKPNRVRLSGAGVADVKMFGHESFDQDDNGSIRASGGYMFDYGEGVPAWQDSAYATHQYTSAGLYTVGLTVRDDFDAISTKVVSRLRILPALASTTVSLTHKPSQFDFSEEFDFDVYRIISTDYPIVEPLDGKAKGLTVYGISHKSKTDLETMQGYARNHTLVKFEYVKLDTTTGTFVGYIQSLRYGYIGGRKDDVMWTATLLYVDGVN